MEIKKKYIKLFKTLGFEDWDGGIYYWVLKELIDIDNEKLVDDLYYNLIHWLTKVNGNLGVPSKGTWTYRNLGLDNLKHIEGNLGIFNSDIISLKNLEYVGGDLFLGGNPKLKELPSLKFVGGNVHIDVHIKDSGITKEYLLNKPDLIIKGGIKI